MAEFRIAPGREGQFNGVAPALIAILKTAAANAPPNVSVVEAFSGKAERGTGTTNHPNGKAVDVRLIDTNGTVLPNSPQDAERRGMPLAPAFRAYEQFAQAAKAAQQQIAPNSPFRWGGYFVQGQPFDLMHFDVTSNTMAGGTWKGGLTPDRARVLTAFNDIPPVSIGMGGAFKPNVAPRDYAKFTADLSAGNIPWSQLPQAYQAELSANLGGTQAAQKAYAALTGKTDQAVASAKDWPAPTLRPDRPVVQANAAGGVPAQVKPQVLPTPPASIPSTAPVMRTAAEWSSSTLSPDVMNKPVSGKAVPEGVGADFLRTVLGAPTSHFGDLSVALAAKKLSTQDPQALASYFAKVPPAVIRAAGAVSQQHPEVFQTLRANATPQQLAPLTAGMMPQPNLSPRSPVPAAASSSPSYTLFTPAPAPRPTTSYTPFTPNVAAQPRPVAATGNTYPSAPRPTTSYTPFTPASAMAPCAPQTPQITSAPMTAPNAAEVARHGGKVYDPLTGQYRASPMIDPMMDAVPYTMPPRNVRTAAPTGPGQLRVQPRIQLPQVNIPQLRRAVANIAGTYANPAMQQRTAPGGFAGLMSSMGQSYQNSLSAPVQTRNLPPSGAVQSAQTQSGPNGDQIRSYVMNGVTHTTLERNGTTYVVR